MRLKAIKLGGQVLAPVRPAKANAASIHVVGNNVEELHLGSVAVDPIVRLIVGRIEYFDLMTHALEQRRE